MGAVIYHGMSINNGSMRQVHLSRGEGKISFARQKTRKRCQAEIAKGSKTVQLESAGEENKILGTEMGPPDEAATAGGGGYHSDIVCYISNFGSFLGVMGTVEAFNSNATWVLCIS